MPASLVAVVTQQAATLTTLVKVRMKAAETAATAATVMMRTCSEQKSPAERQAAKTELHSAAVHHAGDGAAFHK